MTGIIDFHTHAFPDALAERAIPALEAEADGVRACHDGKVSSLLRSMDRSGIETSVVCSIATKPSQFEPIIKWSKEIASPRIVPFLSFHPDDPDWKEKVRITRGEGFKGIKFHPYYQDFHVAEDRMLRIYEELAKAGLIIVMHTGYDIAFERIRRADPAGIVRVYDEFPEIKFVATHFGAWQQWDEVRAEMIGRPIHMEISFALESLSRDEAYRMFSDHPHDRIFFGTDSPWTDQSGTLDLLRSIGLDAEYERAVLGGNAHKLLGSVT